MRAFKPQFILWCGKAFFTGYLNYGLNCREKNEEIISRNSLQHYKRASSFTNKREAAWLHLLPNLSRYRRMSESVQHDEQGSSLHDRWCLRYDEQCSSLHAEGLTALGLTPGDSSTVHIYTQTVHTITQLTTLEKNTINYLPLVVKFVSDWTFIVFIWCQREHNC